MKSKETIATMSTTASLSPSECGHFDEFTLESMQPSDEWEGSRAVDDKTIDESSVPDDEKSLHRIEEHSIVDEESFSPSVAEESFVEEDESYYGKESFFTNQTSFADYMSHLVPTFSVGGFIRSNQEESFSTATYAKEDTQKTVSKAKTSGSSHSRCIIENPESIQDRDDHKQFEDRRERDDDDCIRDQSTVSCSVEEHSQISEITMDMPALAADQRFGQCSTLPTISEVKQFKPAQISATCASGVRNNAKCSAGADTTTNKSEGNNDIIDFVFELVEDALCKPMNSSKSERKKVFMEAFHEESQKAVKLASKHKPKDPFREHSSHSRRSSSKKSSSRKSRSSPTKVTDKDESIGDNVETSTRSTRKSDHNRMKLVDKAPLEAGHPPSFSPLDEELTMDWSKIMSLAEKQLEAEENAEENSVVSGTPSIGEISKMTEKSSFYHNIRYDNHETDRSVRSFATGKSTKPDPPLTNMATTSDHSSIGASPVSSGSNSTSTNTTVPIDVVKELRELSALDSSSFEEESRFLMTSFLFRFIRQLIPMYNKINQKRDGDEEGDQEERAFDEVSELSSVGKERAETLSRKNHVFQTEEIPFKLIQYVAFCIAFIFWPSGVLRRSVPNKPLLASKKKRTDSKPASLLQLVCEKDAE